LNPRTWVLKASTQPLDVTNVTEQRKLGALSLNINYKWEIQAKKAEMISRKEPELDVVYYRLAVNNLDNTGNVQNMIIWINCGL
jgi:hypothetical protein